ncbi:hypothetical protein RJ55_01112 [Drechmeria coniospora]|nr:hypothetical protein RJ55_01112 [Drechmeria coniospora]
MRERVTFVQGPGADFDPTALSIKDSGLQGPNLEASRQDRLTFELDELPQGLAGLLKGYRELHLKWTSPLNYDTVDPFSSRTSPGLHVFCTPSTRAAHDPEQLCLLLRTLGVLDCTSPEAFTKSQADPQSLYFFQQLEDLSALVSDSDKHRLCPKTDSLCQKRLRALSTAATVDLSYGVASGTLKISAFWPLKERAVDVSRLSKQRTEVGIFAKDAPPNIEPHELGVSGLLAVLGEQTEPSPALFSYPSRHRRSDASFSSQFLTPAGLHPTLQLRISSNKPPVPDAECALHAYFTFPKFIFADRYQYEDKLFLASKNLTASRYASLPVDLEAPAYTTNTWGSTVLLELAPPVSYEGSAWTAEMPLHLRYLEPSASGYVPIEVPYPAVFWACDSGTDADFSTNPFDRMQLGYDELFDSQAMFWHLTPQPESGNRIMSPMAVPVLKTAGEDWVGIGTALAVGLGFAWVLWKLVGVYVAGGYRAKPATTSRDKKDK